MSSPLPERIGRYQVQELLGQGGMGNVYLALDPRLKRPLAIKTVRNRDHDDQDRTLERFSREAEISAQLCHPNIITIYDVGEDPELGAFLAMEFVKGQSLAGRIRDRRPGLEASLFLLIQAMRALQAAHDGAIIHRDIKPENMMVSDTGRLKLMDFGLARGDHSRLTATGMVMGTPSFTAPEVMMGKEHDAGTDRYSYYVTAFELLSGELPFRGDSLGSTLYRIVHDPPHIPPSMGPLLAGTFEKALAKDPQARFPDLASFMLELIPGCDLPAAVQAKLLGLVDAEASSREIQSREATRQETTPEDRASADSATQIVLSQLPNHATPPASPAGKSALYSPIVKLPALPKPQSPHARPSGPQLKIQLPHLPKPVAPAPARVAANPVLTPTLTPPGIPLKAHGPAPKKAPPLPSAPLTPAPLRPDPPPPGLPEPLFDFSAGPIDDPFEGLDWDRVLAPEPSPEEVLMHDLEASLEDADVLAAENRAEEAEAREQVKDLEDMLDHLSGADVMEAEERAEAQEAAQKTVYMPRFRPDLSPPPEFGH